MTANLPAARTASVQSPATSQSSAACSSTWAAPQGSDSLRRARLAPQRHQPVPRVVPSQHGRCRGRHADLWVQPRRACTRPVHRCLWPAGRCRWPTDPRRQRHPGGCWYCRIRIVSGGRGQRLANRDDVVSDWRTYQTVASHQVMVVGKDIALQPVEFSASFRPSSGTRTDAGVDDTHAATRRTVQQVRLRGARFWRAGSPLPSSHVNG